MVCCLWYNFSYQAHGHPWTLSTDHLGVQRPQIEKPCALVNYSPKKAEPSLGARSWTLVPSSSWQLQGWWSAIAVIHHAAWNQSLLVHPSICPSILPSRHHSTDIYREGLWADTSFPNMLGKFQDAGGKEKKIGKERKGWQIQMLNFSTETSKARNNGFWKKMTSDVKICRW